MLVLAAIFLCQAHSPKVERSNPFLTTLSPVLNPFPRSTEFIGTDADPEMLARLRRTETIGRTLRSAAFIETLGALPSEGSS